MCPPNQKTDIIQNDTDDVFFATIRTLLGIGLKFDKPPCPTTYYMTTITTTTTTTTTTTIMTTVPMDVVSPTPLLCQACSWNNPVGNFVPARLASEGKIPLDRKPCSYPAKHKLLTPSGDTIWTCSIHNKPNSCHCVDCVNHRICYQKRGYISHTYGFVQGCCGALKREGERKLVKLQNDTGNLMTID